MNIIKICTPFPEQFIESNRQALFSNHVRDDEYKLNGQWYSIKDTGFIHGKQVSAFKRLSGRSHEQTGDILEIANVFGKVVCYAEVRVIKMIIPAQMTDADIHALGYTNRADWIKFTGDGFVSHKGAWLTFVTVLEDMDGLPENEENEAITIEFIYADDGEERKH